MPKTPGARRQFHSINSRHGSIPSNTKNDARPSAFLQDLASTLTNTPCASVIVGCASARPVAPLRHVTSSHLAGHWHKLLLAPTMAGAYLSLYLYMMIHWLMQCLVDSHMELNSDMPCCSQGKCSLWQWHLPADRVSRSLIRALGMADSRWPRTCDSRVSAHSSVISDNRILRGYATPPHCQCCHRRRTNLCSLVVVRILAHNHALTRLMAVARKAWFDLL